MKPDMHASQSQREKRRRSRRDRGERRRLYCPRLAGRTTVVGDGLVAADKQGFVIGVIERPHGSPLRQPEPLTDEQIQLLEEVCGMVQLSPDQARQLPLHQENQRRRQQFEDRVKQAAAVAHSRLGYWPSIRQVQTVLVQLGYPAGRKEKIGAVLRILAESVNSG